MRYCTDIESTWNDNLSGTDQPHIEVAMPALRHLRAPRRQQICIAILSGFILQGMALNAARAQTVPAAAATVSFDLAAAPLVETLDAIGRLTGRTIVFDRTALAGRSAAPVKGSMTARQAVETALKDKDLSAAESSAGVLSVALVQTSQDIVITAQRNRAETSFFADRSDTATRSGTNLMDVPAGVTILTSKVLETQQATSVRDALRNVSGIGFTETPQGLPSFSVRAFGNASLTSNGVASPNAAWTNVFGVERIEVLKGPQAILSGGGSLGGGVNVVTKKPTADPIRDLTLQYGSQDDATIAGDLAGAFSAEDKRLTYRLIGSVARAGRTPVGYDGRSSDYLMPELRWKDASTDVTVGVSYDKQHAPTPRYTFARRDGLIMPVPAIPLSNAKDGFDLKEYRAFWDLEQKLTPNISFISRFQYSRSDFEQHLYSPGGLSYATGAANDNPTGNASFFASRATRGEKQLSGDHYVRAQFETGAIDHKLSLGVNHGDYRLNQIGLSGATMVTTTLYPIAVPHDFQDVSASNQTPSSISDIRQRQKGVYVQDLISYGDWSLLLNLRRTLYTPTATTQFVTANFTFTEPPQTVGATTPGAGVVYRLNPSTSLYASYSEGFRPQTGLSCDGGIVPSIESKNMELGAKFLLMDDKLSLTTSAFQIDQSNSVLYDPLNRCYNLRNAQVTKGLEADLQGELARGWNAVFNYAYTTNKDVTDATRLFAGIPRHKVSLWTTYELPMPSLKGLGVGVGVTATSSVEGTNSTQTYPFKIRSQTQLDASVFYNQPTWSLTLGVKNLTDRRLYGVSSSNAYVPVLADRSFMLTFRSSFR